MTTAAAPRTIATTVTSAGTAPAGKHLPVDATAGSIAIALPGGSAANPGAHLSIEKIDSSSNTVTISGSIRGSASSITLAWTNQVIEMSADAAGSWWPITGHAPRTALDGAYAPSARPAYASARTGVFDQPRSVYNLKPSNTRKLRLGLTRAHAGTGYARFAFAGDSTMAGQGATPATAWPYLVGKRLAARDSIPFGAFAIAAPNMTDPRWTFDASWTIYSAANTQFRNTSTNGAVATFVSENSGTIAEVGYLGNGGPFTVTIDGGAATTVTPPGDGHVTFWTKTGLTAGTHIIAITTTSTSTVYLVGAGVRSATGINILNGAMSGSSTVGWASTGQVFFGTDIINGWTPDVVFLDLEINDLTGSQTLSAWSTRLQAIIAKLQAATSAPDIILCAANPISGYDLTAYTTELYRIADLLNLPVIDFQARLISWAIANADGLMFDVYHPNQLGYEEKALVVRQALGL